MLAKFREDSVRAFRPRPRPRLESLEDRSAVGSVLTTMWGFAPLGFFEEPLATRPFGAAGHLWGAR